MRRLMFLFSFCVFGFGSAPAAAQAIAIDKVLVVVNNEAITLSEYQARHRREVLQQSMDIGPFDGSIDPHILELMIGDRIQEQIALRRGIVVSREEEDQVVAFVARQNNMLPEQLFKQLAGDGITQAQFRASLREQQLIRRLVDRMVNSRITVSDQEVENYLASHQELAVSGEAWEVSHLFIALEGKSESETQSELENLAYIRETVVEGRPFEKVAREFSDGPQREVGGYLGWRKVDQLPKLFVDALRQTEAGGVSEIIRSSNGLHLLKMHNHREREQMIDQQLVRHILIRPGAELSEDEARDLAEEVYARIIAGEDFEAMARVYSADQATGIEGGLLGWASPGDFPPKFEQALAQLELNELSRPLPAPAGYHLVEILDRRRVDVTVQQAAQRARDVIFQRKAALFYDNWYGTIRDAAHIEYVSADPGYPAENAR